MTDRSLPWYEKSQGTGGPGTAIVDLARGLSHLITGGTHKKGEVVGGPNRPTRNKPGTKTVKKYEKTTGHTPVVNFFTGLYHDITGTGGGGGTDTKTAHKPVNVKIPTTEYAKNVQSLLAPYAHAAGQLPKEYQSILGTIHSSTDYTPTEADSIAMNLAKQYSPDITAVPNANGQLAGAEHNVQNVLAGQESPSGPYEQALKNVGTDLHKYLSVAPYKDIMTALVQHLRYSAIYTGRLPGQGEFPMWLAQLYQTASSVSNPFTATTKQKTPTNTKNIKKTNVPPGFTIPGLKLHPTSNKNSPTYTPTPPTIGGSTGGH